MTESRSAHIRQEIESWFAVLARVLTFFLGAVLFTVMVLNRVDIWIAYLGCFALMGIATATPMALMLRAARGGGENGRAG